MRNILTERVVLVLAAVCLDALIGDPKNWWHPVQGIGKLITWTERLLRTLLHLPEAREKGRGKKLFAGVILTVFVVSVSASASVLLIRVAIWISDRLPFLREWSTLIAWLLSAVLCARFLAMRSLYDESMDVYRHLKKKDVEGARRAVSMIVGRDTASLTEEGITKAAVETVAENASDGVIAPLIFMILFGLPGITFYKAASTLDSMVGYRNDRYLYLGRAAARLDDLLNLIPSRISALAMILAAPAAGGQRQQAYRIWRRDRLKHASPNSAQTESACAGALGIELGGDAWYGGVLCKKDTLGDPLRPVDSEDIRRANRLMIAASLVVTAAGVAVMLILYFL